MECRLVGILGFTRLVPFHLVNSLQLRRRSMMCRRNLRVIYPYISLNALFQFESNQLRPWQCVCHFADDISNLIFLFEGWVLFFIQIICNSIKIGQLIISQYWPIGPEPRPRTVIISVADALALGDRFSSELSCFIDRTPSLTASLHTVSYCKIAAKLQVPPRWDKFAYLELSGPRLCV